MHDLFDEGVECRRCGIGESESDGWMVGRRNDCVQFELLGSRRFQGREHSYISDDDESTLRDRVGSDLANVISVTFPFRLG